MDIDLKPVLLKTQSEKFIVDNNLQLEKTEDVIKFLQYKIGVLAPYNEARPYQAKFLDNCLEFRLGNRQTTYQLDDEDDIKIQLAVSGAGKTRTLLELLYSRPGYYFVADLQFSDFGSGDMLRCSQLSCEKPDRTPYFIELLYFVRVFVCNYLVVLGYETPQILLAQLHPKAFFGIDIFKELFESLAKRSNVDIGREIGEECFHFVAIDEIQRSFSGKSFFTFQGSKNLRPFFSPLVFYSKLIGKFRNFIVSGTGINFQYIKELMLSGSMKEEQSTIFQVLSDFHPLDKGKTERYIQFILSEHHIEQEVIDEVVCLVANNELFLGRPRFVAFILGKFLKSGDIYFAISEFMSALFEPKSQLFPLKFYKEDLKITDPGKGRVIGDRTFLTIIRDGLIQYMMTGKATLQLEGEDASDAVRYGIGFCRVDQGIISTVEIEEVAVIECLRYLIPMSDVVKTLVMQISSFPKPQMVGYMLEYLVAYAFVADVNPLSSKQISTFTGSMVDYLWADNSDNKVYFPDHCCGPDILYKQGKILYLIQVKFVNKMPKQERVNACHTTDPDRFYWNSKQKCVLSGFAQRREEVLKLITDSTLEKKRYVFLHTNTKTIAGMEDVQVINQNTKPAFFDILGLMGIWDQLNKIRRNYNSKY